MPSIRTLVRGLAGIRIGRFRQYAPRPLRIPAAGVRIEEAGLPSIAVVTPSLNQGSYIGQAVQSVIGQGYGRLQYVVQDGGSSDGTLQILRQLSGHGVRVHVEPDQGQADAINRGFARTDGEVMGWLNSDDMLAPGALHRVGQIFRDDASVDVVYGNRLIVDGAGLEVGRWILPGHDEQLLRFVDYVPQETMFWRRRLWERVGGCLNAELQFALDWDLILRFVQANAVIRHVPELFGVFRVHQSQKTQARLRTSGLREMRWVKERYGGLQIPAGRRLGIHLRFLWQHRALERRFDGAGSGR
jgi:glycosyltransferase involved in cell wall biosynthesis